MLCLSSQTPNAGVQVQSLVRELRSHLLHDAARKKKKKSKMEQIYLYV